MGYLLAALLGGFLAFNSVATPDRAAHMAQEALQKAYPTAKINVDIEGKRGKAVLDGKFRRIHIAMSDLIIASLPFSPTAHAKKLGKAGEIEIDLANVNFAGLPLTSARFDLQNVEYDFDALKKKSQFQIVRCGPVQMKVQLAASAMGRSMASRFKDIENATISLQDNQLLLTGVRDVMGYKAPIELTAHFVGVGGEVRLDDPHVKFGGVLLPALAANAVLKEVNPIYSFDKGGNWPFRVELQTVTAQNDVLDLSANLFLKSAK